MPLKSISPTVGSTSFSSPPGLSDGSEGPVCYRPCIPRTPRKSLPRLRLSVISHAPARVRPSRPRVPRASSRPWTAAICPHRQPRDLLVGAPRYSSSPSSSSRRPFPRFFIVRALQGGGAFLSKWIIGSRAQTLLCFVPVHRSALLRRRAQQRGAGWEGTGSAIVHQLPRNATRTRRYK